MSWVTILWSMNAAVCLTLAGVYLIVWINERKEWGQLLFSFGASASAVIAAFELLSMHAESAQEYATMLRWAHVPFCVLIVSIVWFARIYLRAGRAWLAWTVTGIRISALIPNFLATYNLNYSSVTGLGHVQFLGEKVAILQGTLNPWMIMGQSSSFLLLIFLVDASVTVWRRGEHRLALFLGGSLINFIVFAWGFMALATLNVIHSPYIVSFSFFGLILVMAYELSRDVLRASHLARELQISEVGLREMQQRLTLATDAAKMGVWVRDFVRNEIWASDIWRKLFGYTDSERLVFENILDRMHPEDREPFNLNFAQAVAGGGHYETEYRLILPDGQTRWIASRGRVELNGGGKPKLLRGVSVDVTARKQAELEMTQQRSELTHLSRVTMLGELSGSIAHELNQPLTAILCNAMAVQHLLHQNPIDLAEAQEALKEIVEEDKRAGEIIHRLRLLLTKGEVHLQPQDLNEVVKEVLKLVRVDLMRQGVNAQTELTSNLSKVNSDRVQIQQVLLNLILNGCDAMADKPMGQRKLIIRTESVAEGFCLSVIDHGVGITPDKLDKVFDPFFTTKAHGMGLGLSVCNTIISAHGGRLVAINNPSGGANFQFVLPVLVEAAA